MTQLQHVSNVRRNVSINRHVKMSAAFSYMVHKILIKLKKFVQRRFQRIFIKGARNFKLYKIFLISITWSVGSSLKSCGGFVIT